MAEGGVVLTTSDVQPVVMAQAMPMQAVPMAQAVPVMAQATPMQPMAQAVPLQPTQIQAQPVAPTIRQNSLRRVRHELAHQSPAMKALFAFAFVVGNAFFFFFMVRGPIMGCGCPAAYNVGCGHDCSECQCETGNIFTCEYMCYQGGERGGFDCYKDGELGSCMDIFGKNGSRTTGEGGSVTCPGKPDDEYCDCQDDCGGSYCDCDEARAAKCCSS